MDSLELREPSRPPRTLCARHPSVYPCDVVSPIIRKVIDLVLIALDRKKYILWQSLKGYIMTDLHNE